MSYQITIESGCLEAKLEQIKPKLIICDRNTQFTTDQYNVEYLTIDESRKDFKLYFELIELFEKYSLLRRDTVVIIGGGVLIDVCSFAATTYKRGIKYINVPTTTLSMIDSSVGSKNGLNYNNQKNIIGTFNDPQEVIIDIELLKTLDSRNWSNGIAEAIKIGYLSNSKILAALEAEPIDLEHVIKLSVDEKLRYVNQDKFDNGYRNRLNFGHTFGHAIEAHYNFNRYLHGEAVSLGMVFASQGDEKLISLLRKFDLPTIIPADLKITDLLPYMHGDKKNSSSKIKFILKHDGEVSIAEFTDQEVIDYYNRSITINPQVWKMPVKVNRSKSFIHRYIGAAISLNLCLEIGFDIDVDLSEDVVQTLQIASKCGAQIIKGEDKLTVDCRQLHKPRSVLTVYKSATTYRLLAPILCAKFGMVEIELDEQLSARPHAVFAPYVNGRQHNLDLSRDYYQIDGSVSSQFISGYALALAGRNAQIEITGGVTSRPYLQLTIDILNELGIAAEFNDNIIVLSESRPEHEVSVDPEPDFSSLANFIIYNRLCEINQIDGKFDLPVYNSNSLQADRAVLDAIESSYFDMNDCPDLLPNLVIFGLFNKQGIWLTNTARIKFKESDRIEAMRRNLAKMGIYIVVRDNEVIIPPIESFEGGHINCYGDHRIAFAFTLAATFSNKPIILDDYTVVSKSFPSFFNQLLRS